MYFDMRESWNNIYVIFFLLRSPLKKAKVPFSEKKKKQPRMYALNTNGNFLELHMKQVLSTTRNRASKL